MPTIDSGSATLAMNVADALRRKMKITSTTKTSELTSVPFTSLTDSSIVCERSDTMCSDTDAGICERNFGIRALTARATSTVLVPGWRWIASTSARSSRNHAAVLSFSTLSMTRPRSSRRTGLPSRYATITGRYSSA